MSSVSKTTKVLAYGTTATLYLAYLGFSKKVVAAAAVLTTLGSLAALAPASPSMVNPKRLSVITYEQTSGAQRRAWDANRTSANGADPAGPMMALCHSPNLQAAFMAVFHEVMTVQKNFVCNRRTKEIVALNVSESNACKFCGDFHGILVDITTDDSCPNKVPLNESQIAQWAKFLRFEGQYEPQEAKLSFPSNSVDAKAELLAVAMLFHFTNRIVDVFCVPSPISTAPSLLHSTLRSAMGNMMKKLMLGTKKEPGQANLECFTQEELCAASTNAKINALVPTILKERHIEIWQAWMALGDAMEKGVADVLAPTSRILLERTAQEWDGEHKSMFKGWAKAQVDANGGEEIADPLQKQLLVFAFFVAFAPHQLTDKEVLDVRKAIGPRGITDLAAYAAFLATMRIASYACEYDQPSGPDLSGGCPYLNGKVGEDQKAKCPVASKQ